MKLDPAEWDLTSCPLEQHPACCYYEYARFSPAVADAVQKVSAAECEALLFMPGLECIALLCPEFPGVPWLKIDQQERVARINMITELAERYRTGMVVQIPEKIRKSGFPIKGPFNEGDATYMPNRHEQIQFLQPSRRSRKEQANCKKQTDSTVGSPNGPKALQLDH